MQEHGGTVWIDGGIWRFRMSSLGRMRVGRSENQEYAMYKAEVGRLTIISGGREVRCHVDWSNGLDGPGFIGIEVNVGLEPLENESIPAIQARAIEVARAALCEVLAE